MEANSTIYLAISKAGAAPGAIKSNANLDNPTKVSNIMLAISLTQVGVSIAHAPGPQFL